MHYRHKDAPIKIGDAKPEKKVKELPKIKNKAIAAPKSLKKECDRVFSLFVRLSASKDEICACFTCDEQFHWKDITNGHWGKRRHSAIRFSEQGCRPQCLECNSFHDGREKEFEARLRRIYVDQVVDELAKLKHTTVKFTDYDYKSMINKYKAKLKALGHEI